MQVIAGYENHCRSGDALSRRLGVGTIHSVGREAQPSNPFRRLHLIVRGCGLGNVDLCLAHAGAISSTRKRASADGEVGAATLASRAHAGVLVTRR